MPVVSRFVVLLLVLYCRSSLCQHSPAANTSTVRAPNHSTVELEAAVEDEVARQTAKGGTIKAWMVESLRLCQEAVAAVEPAQSGGAPEPALPPASTANPIATLECTSQDMPKAGSAMSRLFTATYFLGSCVGFLSLEHKFCKWREPRGETALQVMHRRAVLFAELMPFAVALLMTALLTVDCAAIPSVFFFCFFLMLSVQLWLTSLVFFISIKLLFKLSDLICEHISAHFGFVVRVSTRLAIYSLLIYANSPIELASCPLLFCLLAVDALFDLEMRLQQNRMRLRLDDFLNEVANAPPARAPAAPRDHVQHWPPPLDLRGVPDSIPCPECAICPITFTCMLSPAVTPRGTTYEREAIVRWIHANHRYPGGEGPGVLTVDDLAPNIALRQAVEAWVQEHRVEPRLLRWGRAYYRT